MNRPKRRMRAAAPNKPAKAPEALRNSIPAQVIYVCEKCGSATKAARRKFEGFSDAVCVFLAESDYTE
jgi:hypothetical protein